MDGKLITVLQEGSFVPPKIQNSQGATGGRWGLLGILPIIHPIYIFNVSFALRWILEGGGLLQNCGFLHLKK